MRRKPVTEILGSYESYIESVLETLVNGVKAPRGLFEGTAGSTGFNFEDPDTAYRKVFKAC